jgi:hypothetical protein
MGVFLFWGSPFDTYSISSAAAKFNVFFVNISQIQKLHFILFVGIDK